MDDLKRHTKSFALKIIRFVQDLRPSKVTDVIGKQLLRSATSVGANYRAAQRSKSPADFIAKLHIVEEEGDESMYWLELLAETGFASSDTITSLLREADQIVAMTVSSIKTSRERLK
jgi:four helix bundle protein